MNTLRTFVAALLASATIQATAASAADESAPANTADRPQALARACFGGLEDGKVVVREAHLADASEQTTVENCRIGGGITNQMPRSPTIALGRPAFA